MRSYVQDRGWKLSEYGLFDEADRRLASQTEEEIYQFLSMDWIPPELRENRGEIQAAREHRLPRLVTLAEIRGDLHLHTDWSDGHDSLERMAQVALARGYEYIVVSDHSPSLAVAHGLTVERLREQRERIRKLNEELAPFRILQGAEVNIHPDGSLDYPDEVLAELDLVIASIHSAFDLPSERMTERLQRAISHPFVDILGHPTGRLLNSCLPYELDLEAILEAAARYQVAIEVNGQPERLDLPDVWVQRAIGKGIRIACTSDAHSTRQLENMRWSVAIARRGWAEARHILIRCRWRSCWPGEIDIDERSREKHQDDDQWINWIPAGRAHARACASTHQDLPDPADSREVPRSAPNSGYLSLAPTAKRHPNGRLVGVPQQRNLPGRFEELPPTLDALLTVQSSSRGGQVLAPGHSQRHHAGHQPKRVC